MFGHLYEKVQLGDLLLFEIVRQSQAPFEVVEITQSPWAFRLKYIFGKQTDLFVVTRMMTDPGIRCVKIIDEIEARLVASNL